MFAFNKGKFQETLFFTVLTLLIDKSGWLLDFAKRAKTRSCGGFVGRESHREYSSYLWHTGLSVQIRVQSPRGEPFRTFVNLDTTHMVLFQARIR